MKGIKQLETFVWPVRIYYEDTDAGGVVYNANHLKFMERSRTEWLRSLGFEQAVLREQLGVLLAVRRTEIDYLRPAFLDDSLLVESRVKALGKTSLEFRHRIVRESDGVLCATGVVKVVAIAAEKFRPCAMPVEIMGKLVHV